MKPETAFEKFEPTVNANPDRLAEARLRRNAFVTALGDEADVVRSMAIGSLARKTQKSPLNDVDVVAVFDEAEHTGWGTTGRDSTAVDALTHTAERIKDLLGPNGSAVGLLNPGGTNELNVRLAVKKRHSIKCFLDLAGEEDAFTVDVVPAIAHPARGLWIPERDVDDDDSSTWIRTDPEYLIACTEALQASWNKWIPCVRLLKFWNSVTNVGMSSLFTEVLAYTTLPTNETRPRALARFFQAAESQVSASLSDPAGLSGAIQPDLDVGHARSCLTKAAELAWQAVASEAKGDEDDAVCAWRALFGNEFPEPPSGCNGSVAAAATAAAATGIAAARPTRRSTPRRIKDSPQG